MGHGKFRLGKGALCALGFVLLVAGVALAMESVTSPIPGTYAWSAVTELVPGPLGDGAVTADGCSEKIPDERVTLRIIFGPDGRVRVNGADVGGYEGAHRYEVRMDCYKSGAHWLADWSVVDRTTMVLVGAGEGLCIDGTAGTGLIRATGEDVLLFQVTY